MKKAPNLFFGAGSLLTFKFLKIFLVITSATSVLSAARRHEFPLPAAPTPEALREIADAMGAATYEELNDGVDNARPKVGEIITGTSADVEYQTYQGVVGRPGVDFPVLPSIPQTFFDCSKVPTGYYADLETDCQVFHICDGGRKISFLCPNGTIFRQTNLICDWWFKVDCADSPGQYEESAEHLAEDQRRAGNSNKPQQNFETIHTTQRRPPSNFGSEIITGHNHISDYKAEASFNSVAKSGAPAAEGFRTQESKNAQKSTARSFQQSQRQEVTNSRPYSSFEQTTQRNNGQYEDEQQRKTTFSNSRNPPTRRTSLEYTDSAVYRGSTQPTRNYKETQDVAESASFVGSRSRNNYNYFSSNNFENKPRSTAATPISYSSSTNSRTTRPSYSTTYIPGSKNYVEVTRSVSHTVGSTTRLKSSPITYDSTTVPPNTSTRKYVNSYDFSQFDQNTPSKISNINNYEISKTVSNNRGAKGFQLPPKEISNAPVSTTTDFSRLPIKTENVTFYEPTVPTVTPKAYNSSTNRVLTTNWYSTVDRDGVTSATQPSYSAYNTEPTVSEHAVDMIKTLEELELGATEPTTEAEKILGTRTGLFVPPSAGPNTLHSLAIYFATAVDNFVSTPSPTTIGEESKEYYEAEEGKSPEEYNDAYTSVLSQKTIDKYSSLFKNSSNSESSENSESEELLNNDLESSQSRGPLSSSPQIRELAQVFTHALSAYLQDPETFRKVLSEIRPTDPTNDVTRPTTSSPVEETTPTNNDLYSVAKDEDEVLDFSDVSKNTPRPSTLASSDSTPSAITGDSTKAYSVDLIKNRLFLSSSSYRQQTPVYYSNANDKTPASKYITHDDNDKTQNDVRQAKVLTSTALPSTNNAVALEVNGGLSDSDKQNRQNFENARSHSNCTGSNAFARDSYFPIVSDENAGVLTRYGGVQNTGAENYSPYGTGVKPLNSTAINGVYSGALSSNDGIPLSWGDIISAKISTDSDNNPRVPYLDLVPPSSSDASDSLDADKVSNINYSVPKETEDLEITGRIVVTDYPITEQPERVSTLSPVTREHPTFKYRSHSADRGLYYSNLKTANENEEQLQRAHSQSFVSSANQIGRRGKKIETSKTSKNEQDITDKASINPNETLRSSTDVNLTLPTLKDILQKPVSTEPSVKSSSFAYSTAYSTEPTTIYTTIQETTTAYTTNEETTAQYDPSTTLVYPNPSTNGQDITSQDTLWSTSAALGQIWETTVFLDPITINDGLSSDSAQETIIPSANTYFSGASTKSDQKPELTALDQVKIDDYKNPAFSTVSSITEETTRYSEETTTAYPETQYTKYEVFPPTLSSSPESRSSFQNQNPETSDPIIEVVPKNNREGKSLSTSSPNTLLRKLNSSEVDQTMMNKAKEMFGGLNETSANTLMKVMKKADKNTTVRRLILLLVQTCDDDHNKTIEASRAALLDALMKIPAEQVETTTTEIPIKDDVEITKAIDYEVVTTDLPNYSIRRIDEIFDTQDTKYPDFQIKTIGRKGKRIDLVSSYPNTVQEVKPDFRSSVATELPSSTTLSTTTTEKSISTLSEASTSLSTEAPVYKSTDVNPTTNSTSIAPVVTVKMSRRGQRKYYVKTTKTPINSNRVEGKLDTSAERGPLSSVEDQSVPSDTRALELLRSLYSLAARWG